MADPNQNCEPCNVPGCGARDRSKNEPTDAFLERQAIARRMCRVRHKILVLSGKGGVGKSTIAVNLAAALAMAGKQVGLLDIDVHGPSVPQLLGLAGRPVASDGQAIQPLLYAANLKVMSVGFLLRETDDAVIWRGPMKFSLIKQFVKDVDWGDLDYLVVDSPPGTGDEPLSIAQLIPDSDGAVVVTTPQLVAIADVRRCITFCRALNLPVLGVIENMSGFVCPHCDKTTDLFKSGGGRRMAREMNVPFLGAIPIDPRIVEASDLGQPYVQFFPESEPARAFRRAIEPILAMDVSPSSTPSTPAKAPGAVRLAIPLANGSLVDHLGRTERFALIDLSRSDQKILAAETVPAPDPQPGLWPDWLRARGVDVLIAVGLGLRAVSLFQEAGIAVHSGSPGTPPERLAEAYLRNELPRGSAPIMA